MSMYDIVSKQLAHDPSIVKAIRVANEVIDHPKFRSEVVRCLSFYGTDHDGIEVLRTIDKYKDAYFARLSVLPWSKRIKPWYRNTTAETSGRNVYLNPKFFVRPTHDIVNTLVHEWLHTLGYSHPISNNPTKYPIILNSVNYKVGKIAEDTAILINAAVSVVEEPTWT
jgi:hypothetical protein